MTDFHTSLGCAVTFEAGDYRERQWTDAARGPLMGLFVREAARQFANRIVEPCRWGAIIVWKAGVR